MQEPLLRIDRLTVALPPGADRPLALDGVSLELHAGEVLCLVGESGSGKSVAAAAVMRLLPRNLPLQGGRIAFEGQDLATLPDGAMRRIRGAGIGLVFQEPMAALNPLLTIGQQIAEVFRIHTSLRRGEIRARALRLLEDVHLPDPAAALRAYPHQLSGGQRQRAMIAMALALDPRLLIADEPTTALDVTTQAQVLRLIRELQQRRGTAVLFITHDLGVVADIADRVAVMQHGRVVEAGPASAVLRQPAHAYTQALLAAVPHWPGAGTSATATASAPPSPAEPALAVRQVIHTYSTGSRWLGNRRVVQALAGAELTVARGSAMGIVGESGSGKSTLARCLAGLQPIHGGSLRLEGAELPVLPRRAWRREPGPVQMVFQDPQGSLDPRRRVGDTVAQGLLRAGMARPQAHARVRELFALVGLEPDAVVRHPHEFSGGQRQRIGLARALALEPRVLVADEPVSALDVSVQAQVLRLLAALRAHLGLTLIFITHDLRVAAQVCDRIAVMHQGRVVEEAATAELFTAPRHPYTQALLAAVPGRGWQSPA